LARQLNVGSLKERVRKVEELLLEGKISDLPDIQRQVHALRISIESIKNDWLSLD
jgi:hypothetical protein